MITGHEIIKRIAADLTSKGVPPTDAAILGELRGMTPLEVGMIKADKRAGFFGATRQEFEPIKTK